MRCINLYNRVKHYEEKSKADLEDNRGQRKAQQESLTPEEA
ncbi:hypothetical protein RV10_GL004305 [Enterococcus pallens]|nr:hypothetical protein RV10_GL004305 [Enterococcus pallens]